MKIKHIALTALTLLLSASCAEKYDYPFQNPELPIDERVEDLIGRLTLEEKVGQMMNVTPAIARFFCAPP